MMNPVSNLRRRILSAALLLSFAPAFGTASALQAAKPAPAAKPSAATPVSKPIPDAQKLDINTATADQLKALPGIGDAYSKRIIDGRPYAAKNQLTSKGILPQKTYDGIKDTIIARQPVKK